MNTTQQLRLSIIDIITKIEDINILQSMYAKLSQETKQQKNDNLPAFLEAVTNIRTNVSLEQLMTEQNYKSITYQAFRKKADELEWEETLDELLETLK